MELSGEEHQQLIKHTSDIIMIVSESGTIKYESPSVQRITGYAPDERIGGNAFEHVHPDDQQKVRDTFSEVLESSEDKIVGSEFRFQHKDGSWVWFESRGSTQTVTAIDGYVVSLRDITERKEYEQKLKRERDRLDRFTSVLSHDLRNPLMVVQGRLRLAQEDCESEHLDAMTGPLDRINELIADLLALAREGEAELLLDSVNLRETAENCWGNVETKTADLNIETKQSIVADENQFQRVLENLFRNAVEHGGKDVTVTVGRLEDGFYVEDDGRGIPEDARDSLLEYGFSTMAEGTGFGLSIVHEIVKNHDWNLNVAEGKGSGARFEIRNVTFA